MSQELGQSGQDFAQDLTEVPSVLRYSDILKVGSPVADLQYNTLIPSNGSTFTEQQQIRIPFNVPTDAFVNLKGAYIKMKVNNTQATDSYSLDPQCGVASFIDTFRIVSGTGALIEEIQHYNAAYALMSSLAPPAHTQSSANIQEGASEGALSETAVAGAGLASVASSTTRCHIPHSSSRTLSHIPMSGFFQCDRLVPLGFSTGTAYIEITLPSANFPVCVNNDSSTNISWSISEVELHLPVLRMGAEFNNSFRQLLASGVPINWHSTSFHNVQTNVGSGSTGQTTLTMASRKRSVKSVMTMFRKTADLTSKIVDSASARKSLGITEWNYTIGGMRMPSKNVKQSIATAAIDIGETYSTLVGCLSNLGNIYSSTAMNQDNFLKLDDTGTAAPKVAYGLDLEAYGHSDVQSGKNLANQGLPLVFEATLGASTTNQASSADCLCDCFLLHDVVYSLDGVSGSLQSNA